MGKVVCFGEIMLRLSPKGYLRLVQAGELEAVYGGSEANVAVSLANYGLEPRFVTKLPQNEVGQAAINALRRYGVNTDAIVRGGERIGVYFYERGAGQRPSTVIYDRGNSALANAAAEDFSWPQIFAAAKWFHFSGITPALSENCAAITLEAVQAARRAELMISMDLNYRQKLWSTQQAKRVLAPLAENCDLLVANEGQARAVLGVGQGIPPENYRRLADELKKLYGLKTVALTIREGHSSSRSVYSAVLTDGVEFCRSRKYEIEVVDRIGGGDAFTGSLIYGLSEGMELRAALDFAVAASCLKHTVEGDFNLVTKEEVQGLLAGNYAGRVQR